MWVQQYARHKGFSQSQPPCQYVVKARTRREKQSHGRMRRWVGGVPWYSMLASKLSFTKNCTPAAIPQQHTREPRHAYIQQQYTSYISYIIYIRWYASLVGKVPASTSNNANVTQMGTWCRARGCGSLSSVWCTTTLDPSTVTSARADTRQRGVKEGGNRRGWVGVEREARERRGESGGVQKEGGVCVRRVVQIRYRQKNREGNVHTRYKQKKRGNARQEGARDMGQRAGRGGGEQRQSGDTENRFGWGGETHRHERGK